MFMTLIRKLACIAMGCVTVFVFKESLGYLLLALVLLYITLILAVVTLKRIGPGVLPKQYLKFYDIPVKSLVLNGLVNVLLLCIPYVVYMTYVFSK